MMVAVAAYILAYIAYRDLFVGYNLESQSDVTTDAIAVS